MGTGRAKGSFWQLKKVLHNHRQIRHLPVPPWQMVASVDPLSSAGAKVLVIGLDAADWKILGPLLRQNRLPTLDSLMRRGAWGRLRTLIPAQSPRLWNSIATGKRPGKHGILGFVVRHPKTGQRMPYTSNMRKCKTVWDILSDHGKRVGVVGWWNTWPATPVHGAMVSGVTRYKLRDFDALRSTEDEDGSDESAIRMEYPRKSSLQDGAANRQTHPEELYNEIQPLIRSHDRIEDAPEFIRRFLTDRIPLTDAQRMSLALLLQTYNDDRTYVDIARYLWTRLQPDFLTVYCAGIDVVGHRFWHYMEPERFTVPIDAEMTARYKEMIHDYYILADEWIGELLAMVDQDTSILVLSDHGMSASQRAYDLSSGAGSAEHIDEDGILVMAGKEIHPGTDLGRPSVLDVTPTLLTLMGLPVGADMDGRVTTLAFRKEFLRESPIRYVQTYDVDVQADDTPIESPMDDHLLERLRALGYIE